MQPMEIVSLPEAESTRVEDMPHAEPDPFSSHAESTRVEDTCTASHTEPDPSLPDAESTRVDDMSHAEPDPSPPSTEESSLQDPTPAEQSNMATVIMECLHEVYQDERRHRRLAPWTESPRSWKAATSIVPPD